MVIHRHRQDLFSPFLADDVLVKYILYFMRLGKLLDIGPHGLFQLGFFGYDVVAQFDTFVTYVNRGAGYELFHFILTLSTKGTDQVIGSVVSSTHLGPPVKAFLVIAESIIP
jgi:hypothetical protein